jgi:hypothetical protein
MAGAGAKKFPAFSKLSSDDVNNYLADQVIMRFATTAARDAAFGGVGEPTLAEGMTAYIDADNTIYTYDGSNWVKMVSASTPVGMEKIVEVPTTTGGSVSFTDVFSNKYDNYKLVGGFSTNNSGYCYIRFGGSSTNHLMSGEYQNWNSSTRNGDNGADGYCFLAGNTYNGFASEIQNPNIAANTYCNSVGGGASYTTTTHIIVQNITQFTGFTFVLGAGSFTGGSISLYGYRKG